MQLQEKLQFNLGQNIDVKDSVGKWVNGEVIFIKANELYIHFSGLSSKFDDYFPMNSELILTQWEPEKSPQINNRIDAYHPMGGWLEARIIDIEKQNYENGKEVIKRIKVHYFNFHNKYDRYIEFDKKDEYSIIGSKSKAFGNGKNRGKNKTKKEQLSEVYKKILKIKVARMIQELKTNNFAIKSIEGDGNCLFRSISHQLYGKEDYFADIRQVCMQYIIKERVFFQNFMVQQIEDYVARKSQDGEWGDDVQIEALSEIYGKPIEIYATSSKPIRTFHEDNEHKNQPLRLAYVGACHYNSIKIKDKMEESLLKSPFGEYEHHFLTTYENNILDIARYRQTFANTNDIDEVLKENMQSEQSKLENFKEENTEEDISKKELNNALLISETENLLEQIQKAEMKEIQNRYEQDILNQQMKKFEEKQMQYIKQISKSNKQPTIQRPYWFNDLISQGYNEKEVQFAIDCKGYDPDAVLNFLLDNL